jgi:hypothetical protein
MDRQKCGNNDGQTDMMKITVVFASSEQERFLGYLIHERKKCWVLYSTYAHEFSIPIKEEKSLLAEVNVKGLFAIPSHNFKRGDF